MTVKTRASSVSQPSLEKRTLDRWSHTFIRRLWLCRRAEVFSKESLNHLFSSRHPQQLLQSRGRKNRHKDESVFQRRWRKYSVCLNWSKVHYIMVDAASEAVLPFKTNHPLVFITVVEINEWTAKSISNRVQMGIDFSINFRFSSCGSFVDAVAHWSLFFRVLIIFLIGNSSTHPL